MVKFELFYDGILQIYKEKRKMYKKLLEKLPREVTWFLPRSLLTILAFSFMPFLFAQSVSNSNSFYNVKGSSFPTSSIELYFCLNSTKLILISKISGCFVHETAMNTYHSHAHLLFFF